MNKLLKYMVAWAGAFYVLCGPAARAGVMLEGFYPNVPSIAAGTSTAPWWWDHLAAQANALHQVGFTAIWIPPVLKGAAGGYSSGYDPFDDYDMGSKNEEFTYTTRFGTREQLERCCAMLRASGLDILVDMVENHRNGDSGDYKFSYVDAYGTAGGGRFGKGPGDFHWAFGTNNLPEDPDVPDPANDSAYQFGRDLAPINGFKGRTGRDGCTKTLSMPGTGSPKRWSVRATVWMTPRAFRSAGCPRFSIPSP